MSEREINAVEHPGSAATSATQAVSESFWGEVWTARSGLAVVGAVEATGLAAGLAVRFAPALACEAAGAVLKDLAPNFGEDVAAAGRSFKSGSRPRPASPEAAAFLSTEKDNCWPPITMS